MSGAGYRDKTLRLSRRVYEGLLVAYPGRFRALYGEEMADLFEEACRERLERGGTRALIHVWTGTLADLAVNSAAERARVPSAPSVTRSCGLLSVTGGLIATVCGVVLPWTLSERAGWTSVVIFWELVAMLLLAGGAVGLAALAFPRGKRGGRPARRSRIRGLSCPGLRQGATVVGTVLAGLAMLAAAVLLVAYLPSGEFVIGGSEGVPSGSLPETVLRAFGYLAAFGLPASSMLLGIAFWRSDALGRWRALPAVVGALTCLAPAVGTAAAHAIWAFIPAAEALGAFALVGAPQISIGVGWTALGLLLLTLGEGNGRSRLVTGAAGGLP
jgi:hypothetical protein